VQIALDPFMFRARPIEEVTRIAADAGYEFLELTARDDFLPWYRRPLADSDCIAQMLKACRDADVGLASISVLYNWSNPNQEARMAAVSYWRRAIEVASRLECRTLNTEFSGDPERCAESEDSFWRSIDELLPLFEREGVSVHIEPHPGDFVEDNDSAVDMVRGIGSTNVRYQYCAPHTFHMGDDVAAMIRYSAPVLAHVHIADTYNHKASEDRYILNPAKTSVRVHQHNVIGQGEVDWDAFFGTLIDIGFDGILTSCVMGWEDRAVECVRTMRELIDQYLNRARADAAAQ